MKKIFLLKLLSLFVCVQLFAQADWTHLDANNKLVYKTDANGNRIMDFSYAGYMGGGVAIPDVPVKVTLNATSGDRSDAIQNAINQVAAMPLVNGYKGTVLLGPGTFDISKTINLNSSGVVLRGSGSGNGGTVINMTGSTGYLCFKISGSGSYSTSGTVNLTDSYIPSGTQTFNVNNASGYKVGDNILIYRTVTQEWVHYLGMDTLTLHGQAQTWIKVGTKISTDRTITAINGNKITIDAPLTDNFDSKYLGNPVGTIAKYTFAGRISQVGLEHLKIQAPQGEVVYNAVVVDNIIDSWVSDVVGQETLNAFFVNKNAKRITFDKVINNVTVKQTNPAPTCDFSATGTQILLNKCQSNGNNNWPATTMNLGTGPIVFLYFSGTATRGITPHMRWTTGILSDNASLPNPPSNTPGVSYRNRGNYGSGHGWCTGWSVIWNAVTPYVTNSQAPGTLCWAIGGKAKEKTMTDPRGIFDHFNTNVIPQSLYLQQLQERLGQDAIDNIGYGSTNKSPTVSITSPANNASFTAPANITINANASDSDGNISKVDFYNGSTLLGTSTASPFSFTWSNVAVGTYSLTAKATDNKGAVTTSAAVTINVTCASTAIIPYVQVNGGTWQNSLNATLDAGGSLKFGPQPNTGGSWSWTGPGGFSATSREVSFTNIQTNQAGNYIANYTNAEGCKSTATFVVTVNSTTSNTSPTVSITSPVNNASVTAPANITINANASDNDGSVTKVEFYNGNTKLGEDATSPYSFVWNNVAAGTYTITAKATDDKGASTISAAVSVTVKASTDACSGIPSYVENGGYVDGSKVQNAGGIYKCKPYPYTGWCNGAAWAYAPGTGSYWTDAWDKVGTCSGARGAVTETANRIELYPNPTENSSMIKLNIADVDNAEITVMNSLGVVVYKTTLNNQEAKIDLTGVNNGIYMIQIKSNDQIWFEKLIKE